MAAEKPIVRNAADEQQVKKGKLTEQQREEERVHNLGEVVATYEGRQFYWDLLADCKVYESIFDTHGSRMSFMSGQQDLGHKLMAQLQHHYPHRYLEMQREHMERVGLMAEPEPTVHDA